MLQQQRCHQRDKWLFRRISGKDLIVKAGSQFVVVGDKDVVILKFIAPPSMDNFGDLIKKARSQGKKAGIKRSDITVAIAKTRGGK